MALTKTPLCKFGLPATNFSLMGVDDQKYTLQDIKGPNGTLIMFICNHCPYVLAIIRRLVEDVQTLQSNGIGVIAIMPNAVELEPRDSMKFMKQFSQSNRFTFPYVIDETQEIARKYDAVCPPDFFGFNSLLQLEYRGRLDEAGKTVIKKNTKRELLDAMLEVSKNRKGPQSQFPSMGCSIKWR